MFLFPKEEKFYIVFAQNKSGDLIDLKENCLNLNGTFVLSVLCMHGLCIYLNYKTMLKKKICTKAESCIMILPKTKIKY